MLKQAKPAIQFNFSNSFKIITQKSEEKNFGYTIRKEGLSNLLIILFRGESMIKKSKVNGLALLLILALLTLLISACGGANNAEQEPGVTPTPNETDGGNEAPETSNNDEAVIAQGEEIVQKNCIGCHGGNLEGGVGPSLYNLSNEYSEEEIKDILINGQGSMPGGLAQGHEDAVIAYLLTLQ